MANILTSTKGIQPEIDINKYDNYYKCIVDGRSVVIRKTPEAWYQSNGLATDALALSLAHAYILQGKSVSSYLASPLNRHHVLQEIE